MAKFIKNADTIDHIWAGQTIEDGDYYELPLREQFRFSSDSQFLIDLANGKAVMAKTNDGNNDIEDVATALIFLKSEDLNDVSVVPSGSFEKRLYKLVSGYDSEILDYTPEDGETLVIYQIGGSAALDSDIKCEVIWDPSGTPEIIFATHSSNTKPTRVLINGDGSKVLRIKLTNDTSISETIGAFWMGRIE